jgi:hypothetical protein
VSLRIARESERRAYVDRLVQEEEAWEWEDEDEEDEDYKGFICIQLE